MALVVTYSSLLPDVHGIVKKHMDVLYRFSRMTEVFKEPPIVAFRRDKNLCDMPVHGKMSGALRSTRTSCKTHCENCRLLSHAEISDTSCQVTYSPVQDITCHMRNVVYAIIRTKCWPTVHVGETERELRERMTEHLRDMRLRKDKPINFHFGEKGHTQHDMAFTVLEKVYAAERIERQLREGLWIRKLSTVQPGGLQCKRLFHTSSGDVMAEKVKKYGNDVTTPLATSCLSVNKSCARYDSHNVVNLQFLVIFS